MKRSGYSWQDEAGASVKTGDGGLVDIKAAAKYLGGISQWTVRSFVADGHLCPVRLPSVARRGEASRRLLFDVRDLDALIDRCKAESSTAPNAQLSAAALKGWKQTPRNKGVA